MTDEEMQRLSVLCESLRARNRFWNRTERAAADEIEKLIVRLNKWERCDLSRDKDRMEGLQGAFDRHFLTLRCLKFGLGAECEADAQDDLEWLLQKARMGLRPTP